MSVQAGGAVAVPKEVPVFPFGKSSDEIKKAQDEFWQALREAISRLEILSNKVYLMSSDNDRLKLVDTEIVKAADAFGKIPTILHPLSED